MAAADDDARAMKQWRSIQARLAMLGVSAYRATDDSGHALRFFTVTGRGSVLMHPDLHSLRRRAEEIEAGGGAPG
jgi:hypothetical protein